MNTRTVALALGVAGVLLVAGLATLFSSTPLSELLNNNKGTSEGSNNNPDDDPDDEAPDDNSAEGDEGPGGNKKQILPTEPIPTSPTPLPAETVQGEPNL